MKQLLKIGICLLALAVPAFADGPYHTQTLDGMMGSLLTKGGKYAETTRLSGKKYLFIYFSAHWCPPCRTFTPKLVEFYNTNSKNADFDLLFVSSDKDQAAMDGYMTETSMPWVGLKVGHLRVKQLKEKYGVSGIPCLVLLDDKDQVVASSYEGTNYLGPQVAIEKYLSLKKQ